MEAKDKKIAMKTEGRGILGKDYVTLKGKGGREYQNGATVEDNPFIHLSVDMGQSTICNRAVEKFFLTYGDVDINCPDCIKNLKKKARARAK